MFAHGSSVHQKWSNYTLTNLLFGLCRFVWIFDPLITRLNPHPKALACPFTPKMLRTRECTPTPYPFAIFTFGLAIESIKEFGVCHHVCCYSLTWLFPTCFSLVWFPTCYSPALLLHVPIPLMVTFYLSFPCFSKGRFCPPLLLLLPTYCFPPWLFPTCLLLLFTCVSSNGTP
jgi:hypothetical protein